MFALASALCLLFARSDVVDVEGNTWQVYFDEHDRPYYHNAETGETQWTKPEVMKQSGPSSLVAQKSVVPPDADAALMLRDERYAFVGVFDHLLGVKARTTLPVIKEKGLDALFAHGGGIEAVKAKTEWRLIPFGHE